jgi:HAD superfamily hydrolase (TIGR01459 family)
MASSIEMAHDAPRPGRPVAISALRLIADRFDGFILDLWGCLHDGLKAYPAASELLRALRRADKRVMILSNAPRRADAVIAGMHRVGLPAEEVDAVLSSGELAWQAIARRQDPWHAKLGRRCYLLGPERDRGMLVGNGLGEATRLAEADFVLATGPSDDSLGVADHEAFLAEMRERALPMICANPDLDVMKGAEFLVCAGAIAARFQALGGDVHYHGKPHRPTYVESVRLLGLRQSARVLAVGDTLRTDIAGARAAGMATAFIPGGIHGRELGVAMGAMPSDAALAELFRREATTADYVIGQAVW